MLRKHRAAYGLFYIENRRRISGRVSDRKKQFSHIALFKEEREPWWS